MLMHIMKESFSDNPRAWALIFAAWLIACIATGGSLFFSEVMAFSPCVLCWYQRIAMYPLVLILLVGMFPINRQTFKFSIPLVGIGWLLALYHNLLHYEIVPESASPCREGVSCATIWLDWLGFITIPLMSFVAFTIIGLLLIIFYRKYCR